MVKDESMQEEESRQILSSAILEVVENQLRENNPPEAKQTYQRLIREGHSPQEAKRLIGCAITVEMYHAMKNHEKYNPTRYIQNLNDLPRMPWAEDKD